MQENVKVFISYAHEDEALCQELEKHLSSLRRDELIETWHDRSINAGVDWKKEIDYHLDAAQFIFLLISADFLASDYCYSIEMERALVRHREGKARVIPIILRSVDWKTSPLKEIQALPTDGKPVISSYWHTPDDAFQNIVEGIRRIIENLSQSSKDHQHSTFSESAAIHQKEQENLAGRSVDTIPVIKDFVGRTEEIKYYRESLNQDGVAIIGGMPGIGKTALGAKLARSARQQNKFWMTFRPDLNDNLDSIFWQLGNFFSTKLNDHHLARMLELEPHLGKPYSVTLKTHLLVNTFIATSSLLCFDDFHIVLENKTIVSFFQEVIAEVQRLQGKNARIIIMTREHPFDSIIRSKRPLKGLTLSDTKQLLTNLKIALNEELFLVLCKRTQGNPQFLRAFQYLLLTDHYQVDLLQKISQSSPNQDIWDFLIGSVYESLNEDERIILSALSIIRLPSSPRQVEDVSGSAKSSLTLRKLNRKFLLEEPLPGYFSLHPLIKDFFYELMSTNLCETLHTNAAMFYMKAQEHIEVIYHYWQANKFTEAIQHLTKHYYEIRDRGQAGSAYQMIMAMEQARLSAIDRLILQKVKGELQLLQGQYEEVIVTFQTAQIQPEATGIQKADFWRYIGNAQGHVGKYDDAIKSFKKGIAILGNKDSSVLALLNVDMGYFLYRKREFASAQLAIESGLQDLRDNPTYQIDYARGLRHLGDTLNEIGLLNEAVERYTESMTVCKVINDKQGLARCYDDLGNILYHKGEWKKAIELHGQAIEILEGIGDLLGLAIAYGNLGNVQFVAGDWDNALVSHQQSLRIGEQIDNVLGTAICSNNIGNIYRARGDWATALKHYQRSLQIGIQLNDLLGQALTYGYLGLTYYEMGELDVAFDHFTKALQCADSMQSKRVMGLARLNMVITYSTLGDVSKAEMYLEQANVYFTEIDAKFELGLARRFRGELDLTNNNVSEAIDNLKQAETIFHDLNSQFEVAKTQTDLSRAYKASGEQEISWRYAEEALTIFEQRDAKGEMNKMKDLLRSEE